MQKIARCDKCGKETEELGWNASATLLLCGECMQKPVGVEPVPEPLLTSAERLALSKHKLDAIQRESDVCSSCGGTFDLHAVPSAVKILCGDCREKRQHEVIKRLQTSAPDQDANSVEEEPTATVTNVRQIYDNGQSVTIVTKSGSAVHLPNGDHSISIQHDPDWTTSGFNVVIDLYQA